MTAVLLPGAMADAWGMVQNAYSLAIDCYQRLCERVIPTRRANPTEAPVVYCAISSHRSDLKQWHDPFVYFAAEVNSAYSPEAPVGR